MVVLALAFGAALAFAVDRLVLASDRLILEVAGAGRSRVVQGG
jgi:hypothetical protein